MTTAPSSPRRRHILSSINPDLPRLSPEQEDRTDSYHTAPLRSDLHHVPDDAGDDERAHSRDPDSGNNESKRHSDRKTTKFRFKSKHSSSHRSSRRRERDYDNDDDRRHRDRRPSKRSKEEGEDEIKDDNDPDREPRRSRHRSHHSEHRHRRRKHRHRTRTRSPTPPNPHEPPPLDPEAAFRESLFDAMADDEGAAYWEGVYGQPIHVYANARPTGGEGGGELEQMTEDEYAAYVRQKMWEKTHQGLLEERARREEAKRAKDDKEAEVRRLTRQMEESLRRGEERRRRRSWRGRYEEYAAAWADWDGTLEGMSWPVTGNSSSTKSSGGDRAEISSKTVRDFFVNGLDPIEIGESVFLAKLKEERVRWHPDKIQQRLGPGFDEAVRRDVTAVFQIIDKLWSDIRAKAKAKA